MIAFHRGSQFGMVLVGVSRRLNEWVVQMAFWESELGNFAKNENHDIFIS